MIKRAVVGESVFIYALKDPDTLAIRYIGQSVSPRGRLTNHLTPIQNRSETPLKEWICALRDIGKQPLMEILEQTEPSAASAREQHWIDLHASPLLLNSQRAIPRVVDGEPKKMGRPYGQHYTEIRQIRMSPRQSRLLQRIATQWDCPAVEAIRRMIEKEAEARGIEDSGEE